MDITYLLWLQELRNGLQDTFLTPFMQWVSTFSIREIIFLPAFMYWCFDKRNGLFVMYSWKVSHTLNSLVKLTACIYRPWVRDSRIVPFGNSIKTAGGYSFPSGHTMMAAPIYGSLALMTKNKFLRVLLIFAIFLTAFSRNYLGVHTPQDVLVGIVLGFFAIYISKCVFDYMDRHPEKDIFVILISGAVGILTLVYITYKPYPMEYVDGKLLVDPVKMTQEAWGDTGGLIGLTLAWYIESRFVKFTPTGWNVKGVILCVIGLIPLHWIIYNMKGVMTIYCGPHWGNLTSKTVLYLYIMVVWPVVLKFANRKN